MANTRPTHAASPGPIIRLTREVRFALAREVAAAPAGSANGFAGSPALEGIAPFLALAATIAGPIDATTGMLINIKVVDKVLRDHAVDFLRASHYVAHRPVTLALGGLFPQLASRLLPHGLEALALRPSPFLTFCVHCKEPHMVRTTQRFEFSAAHRLHAAGLSEKENQEVFGRCTNPNGHGHNYELEVILAGEPDAATGQILPGGIPEVQQLVNRHIIDVFDHKHLNLDCAEFRTAGGLNPTVENIARIIYERLRPQIPGPARLHAVRVWETPKTVAEYGE